MQDKPVFLGGFRSGSTLLINLLGMHDDIAPWFETKAFTEALRWLKVLNEPELAEREAGYVVPATPPGFELSAVKARMWHDFSESHARVTGIKGSGKAAHESYLIGNDCIGYTEDQAKARLELWSAGLSDSPDIDVLKEHTANLINSLAELHLSKVGGTAWVNKTPELPRFAREIRSCLGDCRIIYLVRDGLDVSASASKLGWGSLELMAFNWKGLLENTRIAMQGFEQDYLELRYEDLVQNPSVVLARVLDFCGHSCASAAQIVENYIAQMGEGAFDTSRLGAGKLLAPAEKQLFAKVAGDLQTELGYTLDN